MPPPPTNVISCAIASGAEDFVFTSLPVVGSVKRNDTGSYLAKDAVSAAVPCSQQRPLHLFHFCTHHDKGEAVDLHEKSLRDRAEAINIGDVEDLLSSMGMSAMVKEGDFKGEIRGGN